MVKANNYYKSSRGIKIEYALLNKDQAKAMYDGGYRNIFYNTRTVDSLVGDALVLWMNYDDDKDQWEELDRLFGGCWWRLDYEAYIKLYGKTYEESKGKVITNKPRITNSTIPDPWDYSVDEPYYKHKFNELTVNSFSDTPDVFGYSNRVDNKNTNTTNTDTTDTDTKPTAHKDTSGFRLGDWDKATNLSKPTPTSSSDLPKDKVTLPNYDDYIKEVQSYLKHQKPESEVKSSNGLPNDDFNALMDYVDSLHQQRYKLPKVEFKHIPDVKVTLSGVSDSKVTLKLTPFQQSLKVTLDSLYELLSKNELRNLERLTRLTNSKPGEVLRQLIDYKLTSIRNTATPSKQDVTDLIGYLITYSIEQGWIYFNDK